MPKGLPLLKVRSLYWVYDYNYTLFTANKDIWISIYLETQMCHLKSPWRRMMNWCPIAEVA